MHLVAQAAEEGFGDALISGLKKLARENLADLSPSPLLVKLTYSHPPLSERITAIEKKQGGTPAREIKRCSGTPYCACGIPEHRFYIRGGFGKTVI